MGSKVQFYTRPVNQALQTAQAYQPTCGLMIRGTARPRSGKSRSMMKKLSFVSMMGPAERARPGRPPKPSPGGIGRCTTSTAVQKPGRMQDTQSKRGNKALVITQSRMSALGHKRTFSDTLSNVRYWGQSGSSGMTVCMSAYSQKRTFSRLRRRKTDQGEYRWPNPEKALSGCLAHLTVSQSLKGHLVTGIALRCREGGRRRQHHGGTEHKGPPHSITRRRRRC